MKYVTTKILGIITQIAKETEVKGYTVGILEVFLPDENELTKQETLVWIEDNNKRMIAICDFLNTKEL